MHRDFPHIGPRKTDSSGGRYFQDHSLLRTVRMSCYNLQREGDNDDKSYNLYID